MNEELLKYYNRELAFIRHMGAEFAEQYPKLAGRLRLSDEHVEDPHVSRLIEAFSLLTAQIRQKLDDSFPELTEALLGQLYPDYQAPIPSMSVIKVETENVSTTGVLLARGSQVDTQVEGMKTCHFKTCYDTQLWPIDVSDAQFENAPFNAPEPIWNDHAKSSLKLTITGEFDEVSMSTLSIDRLRFFLNGQAHQTYHLYQMLFEHCIGMAISPKGTTTRLSILKSVIFRPWDLTISNKWFLIANGPLQATYYWWRISPSPRNFCLLISLILVIAGSTLAVSLSCIFILRLLQRT